MPGSRSFAQVSFTLTDCIIAAYNLTTNTYGTVASLFSGQIIEVEAEADNDALMGYGAKTALLSVVTGAKIKFGGGGVDSAIMGIVSGTTNSTSGSAPQRVRKIAWPAGGSGLPYFGLIGVGATDDGGLLTVGLQCCKLNTHPKFTLDGKANKFNMSETDGEAIPVAISTVSTLMIWKELEDATTWAAPAVAANFLLYFTG